MPVGAFFPPSRLPSSSSLSDSTPVLSASQSFLRAKVCYSLGVGYSRLFLCSLLPLFSPPHNTFESLKKIPFLPPSFRGWMSLDSFWSLLLGFSGVDRLAAWTAIFPPPLLLSISAPPFFRLMLDLCFSLVFFAYGLAPFANKRSFIEYVGWSFFFPAFFFRLCTGSLDFFFWLNKGSSPPPGRWIFLCVSSHTTIPCSLFELICAHPIVDFPYLTLRSPDQILTPFSRGEDTSRRRSSMDPSGGSSPTYPSLSRQPHLY